MRWIKLQVIILFVFLCAHAHGFNSKKEWQTYKETQECKSSAAERGMIGELHGSEYLAPCMSVVGSRSRTTDSLNTENALLLHYAC